MWPCTQPIREMGAGSAHTLEQGWRKLRFAKTSAAKGKRPARERSVSTRRRSVRELGAGSACPLEQGYTSKSYFLFANIIQTGKRLVKYYVSVLLIKFCRKTQRFLVLFLVSCFAVLQISVTTESDSTRLTKKLFHINIICIENDFSLCYTG